MNSGRALSLSQRSCSRSTRDSRISCHIFDSRKRGRHFLTAPSILKLVRMFKGNIYPKTSQRLTREENDNMRGEYSRLYSDIAEDIPWATECLGAEPDAVNLWIGNSLSVTSLHKDNYENIYCQMRGKKHFVLLPPVETPCVNVTYLAQAKYAHDGKAVNSPIVIFEAVWQLQNVCLTATYHPGFGSRP